MKLQVSMWGPLPFKAPGRAPRKPVPGGRFKIRRMEVSSAKPWRAWNDGKAFGRGKRFATHAEAIAWAHATSYNYQLREALNRKHRFN